MEKIEDQELIRRAIKNPDNFGEIVERYEKKLNGFLLHLGILNPDDREDLLQDIFWKVYKNLNDFDDSFAFPTWIYRIARNHVYDAFRKTKSRGKKLELSEESAELFWNNLTDPALSITEKFDQKKRQKIVTDILETVPKKYREALILFFLEDQSYHEISDILQKNENSIATLISRGKAKFKKLLSSKFEINEL